MKILKADPDARVMSEDEVRKFLSRPHLLRLALVDEEGFPVVYPLWYAFEDDRFWVCTARESRKARLLRSNPKAYFIVDVGQPGRPPRGVRGRAEAILHDEARDRSVEITLKTLARYTGATEGPFADEFLEAARKGETSVIEVVPRHFASWNYR